MYSLRYGTIPIVRNTGGLADTVRLYDPVSGEGTGFVFDHFTADGLRWAMEFALSVWPDNKAWRKLQRAGMACDYSWEHQSKLYVELYRRMAGR
jgi:starch synthase